VSYRVDREKKLATLPKTILPSLPPTVKIYVIISEYKTILMLITTAIDAVLYTEYSSVFTVVVSS